jgi:fatty-acid peroxygenase
MVASPPTTYDRPPGTAVHAGPDRSVPLRRVGYPYLLRLRERWHTGTAEIRLLGRRTTVLSGPEGVRLFYNEDLMRRRDALPRPLARTLFGRGAVHGLDDAEHQHRKSMFLRVLDDKAAHDIAAITDELWRGPEHFCVVDPEAVFGQAVDVHCAAACRWAGVPADAVDPALGRDLMTIVDGFGSLGPRWLRARGARRRVDKWARRLVARARGGHRKVESDSPLGVLAAATAPNGTLLRTRVAGVELINVLRPTVAVAYFVAFTAHALQEHPELRERLHAAPEEVLEAFAHEVRRYYPFVPMLAARARRSVTFQGRPLVAGRRVLLDVYGTLHDPQLWDEPERFDCARFRDGSVPEHYIPQGGGDVVTGHRCPGERVAVELIKVAARRMVARPAEQAPATRIPLNRLPTRPVAVDEET